MLQNARNKMLLASVIGATVLGLAGTAGASAPADPLSGSGGAIETVQDQIVGYAVPIGAALVAVGLAYVAVKLIPRVIRMVSARLG